MMRRLQVINTVAELEAGIAANQEGLFAIHSAGTTTVYGKASVIEQTGKRSSNWRDGIRRFTMVGEVTMLSLTGTLKPTEATEE